MGCFNLIIDSKGRFEGYTLLSITDSDYEIELYLVRNSWKKSKEGVFKGFDEYGTHINLVDDNKDYIHIGQYLNNEVETGKGNVIKIDTLLMDEYYTG